MTTFTVFILIAAGLAIFFAGWSFGVHYACGIVERALELDTDDHEMINRRVP